MKAYIITDRNGYCEYSKIVFADTAGKAKAYAAGSDGFEDFSFTEIRAIRRPQLDAMYHGVIEMDWLNDRDRIAMVKLAGFRCTSDYDCEGKSCPAYEFCERAQEEAEEEKHILNDGKRCEEVCKHAPPENKWPCVDCDMRVHDRAEPKEET